MSRAGKRIRKHSLTIFISMLFLGTTLWGNCAVAADQWSNVFRFQQIMAERGNVEAQYLLGEMYEEGRGIPKDLTQAKIWYERSAAQGHSGAQQRLARFGTENS